MEKRELRQSALRRRDALSGEQRKRKSEQICRKVLAMEWYKEAEVILSYASFRSEVDTTGFNRKVIEDGKKLYLPKTDPLTRQMEFYPVARLSCLKAGYKGILEPEKKNPLFGDGGNDQRKTLMVMPGVAFDEWGNRIGYGGGYYDRYLLHHQCQILHQIMLGFTAQMVPMIPEDKWDIRPECIVTED